MHAANVSFMRLMRVCCKCVITGVYSRECCECVMCVDAVNVARVMGYAVNVACEGSLVRDIRCVCKGCVLGTEVCFVDIVGKPVVYRP